MYYAHLSVCLGLLMTTYKSIYREREEREKALGAWSLQFYTY